MKWSVLGCLHNIWLCALLLFLTWHASRKQGRCLSHWKFTFGCMKTISNICTTCLGFWRCICALIYIREQVFLVQACLIPQSLFLSQWEVQLNDGQSCVVNEGLVICAALRPVPSLASAFWVWEVCLWLWAICTTPTWYKLLSFTWAG